MELNSSIRAVPSLLAISFGIFFELVIIKPKTRAVIGPLYPNDSDNPYKINKKANEVNMLLGNFLTLLRIFAQIKAPIVPTINANTIDPIISNPSTLP